MTQSDKASQRKTIEYPTAEPWIRIGFAMIFITLGSLVAVAGLAGISGAVIGAGTVTVETNIKTVQHLDGGIVAELLVKNGDRVKEGDVVMRLDDTSAKSNLGIIQGRLDELYIQRARLEAESRGAERITVPTDLIKDKDDPRIAAFLSSQIALFNARRQRQQGEASLLLQQRAQLEEQIRGATSEVESRSRQLTLIRREMESVRPLLEQGL